MRLVLACLAALALFGAAMGAKAQSQLLPPPKDGALTTRPIWTQTPSGDDLLELYPPEAMQQKLGGRAVIACTVTAEGRLTDCSVESETPPGAGFGAAAVRMASLFQMATQTAEGAPVEGGRVKIPIVFQPPE